MLEDFDPNTIEDEGLRQVVRSLMNLVETLHAKVQEQADEIQRLRDENNRLKGEQGKPTIKPDTPPPAPDHSSERERHQPTERVKRGKQATITIDREQVVHVDRSILPTDAEFKGYEDVVV